MSQIKLLHSGGNGVILSAPASNPAADRTLTLPGDADGTILTSNSATGKILQIQSTVLTGVVSTTSSSYTDISGFSVNITPSATSSKILVQAAMRVSGIDEEAYLQMIRSVGGTDTAIGNGTGGNHASFTQLVCWSAGNGYYDYHDVPFLILDSPNTTSAITYKLQWRRQQSSTLYIGRTGYSTTASSYSGSSSNTIMVMEVAG